MARCTKEATECGGELPRLPHSLDQSCTSALVAMREQYCSRATNTAAIPKGCSETRRIGRLCFIFVTSSSLSKLSVIT